MKRSIPHALDVRLKVNINDQLNAALAMAANKRLVSVSSWCRQALLEALEKEGVELEKR